MYYVFVVSDGTGGTAERALQAALTQFEGAQISIKRYPYVRNEEQINEIVQEVARVGGFIVHTLVSNEAREAMIRIGRENNVETIDLMGPLLARLSHQLRVSPLEKPGLFSQLNQDYFRRIETMEFAFHHDDGQRVEDLHRADLVLVGVSRTFKTPLSIYLAFKGWFVANVPIILDVEPPAILSELSAGKIFGLTMNTYRLATLRQARVEYLGESTSDYADLEYVRREVLYALHIFESPPKWSVINVTNKPIEEIASEILALYRKNQTSHSSPPAM